MSRQDTVNKVRTPLISIIVPIYNVENYVSECIESIIQQTYQKLQILLIDDGSTDTSGEICDRYADKDKRIKVIHQKNTGVSLARKNALAEAKGEYIGFVDGDDFIVANMYEQLLKEIQNSDADFVHSGYIQNGQHKILYKPGLVHLSTIEDKIKYLKDNVYGENSCILPSLWSKLYKSDIIKKCYKKVPYECYCSEDQIILCASIMESNKILLIDGAYYQYRYREVSITNKREFGRVAKEFQLFKYLENVFSTYKCYGQIKDVLLNWEYQSVLRRMRYISQNRFQTEVYHYEQVDELLGKKIVVYGAGEVGQDYYTQICRYTECQVVAWVDKYSKKYNYPYIKVRGLDDLKEIDFDMLIIAVEKRELAEDIRGELSDMGINIEKIVWNKPQLAYLS